MINYSHLVGVRNRLVSGFVSLSRDQTHLHLVDMETNILSCHVSFHNDYCASRCASVQSWLLCVAPHNSHYVEFPVM